MRGEGRGGERGTIELVECREFMAEVINHIGLKKSLLELATKTVSLKPEGENYNTGLGRGSSVYALNDRN